MGLATPTSPTRSPDSRQKVSSHLFPDKMNAPSCNVGTNWRCIRSTEWWTPALLNSPQKHRITTPPTNPLAQPALTACRTWKSEQKNDWWPSEAVRFASVKASNLTTAAFMPSKPFAKLEKTPSSSTTTRKPSQRILTRPTGCTSIR